MKPSPSLSYRIGSGIDRTLGVFFPQAGLKRTVARMKTDLALVNAAKVRQYAAAKVNRYTGDWIPVNQDINSLLRTSAPMVRARVRQLVRDFPFFTRATNILTDYTVGEGIRFQSRVKDERTGEFDRKTAQKIEDALKWWMDEADIARKLHYFEMDRLAKRQESESGEYIFIKRISNQRNRFSPFALQAIESDWLTDLHVKVESGNLVDQGVEYDELTGEPQAYHFMIPSGFNTLTGSTKSVRVPASEVIHGFETLRPGQNRGISPFASAVLVAHDLSDFLDAEIDGAKLAAKYLAFIKTNDIEELQSGRTKTDSDDNKKIEEMENAIIEYLRPGEDITLASHNRPGDSFTPFTKFVLRMVAVATGTSYELLSGDYSGLNYTTLRAIRNDLKKQFKPHIFRHTFHFSRQAVNAAMDAAVLAGKLDLRNYHKNPRFFQEGVFIAPGMESIDPLRETKANIDQIKAGLRSPQEITASRGRDFEEVVNETAEAKKMVDEKGLFWPQDKISANMQTNPASLGAK